PATPAVRGGARGRGRVDETVHRRGRRDRGQRRDRLDGLVQRRADGLDRRLHHLGRQQPEQPDRLVLDSSGQFVRRRRGWLLRRWWRRRGRRRALSGDNVQPGADARSARGVAVGGRLHPRRRGSAQVVFGQRALRRALVVREAVLLAQLHAAVAHALDVVDVVAIAGALALEGADEGLAAVHEVLAALARQADPFQVLVHRVAAGQAV